MRIYQPTLSDLDRLGHTLPALLASQKDTTGALSVPSTRKTLFKACMDQQKLVLFAEQDDMLCGIFIGAMVLEQFTDVLSATQVGVIMAPGMTGHWFSMVQRFKAWAKLHGALNLYVHLREDSERARRVLARLAFFPGERHYVNRSESL